MSEWKPDYGQPFPQAPFEGGYTAKLDLVYRGPEYPIPDEYDDTGKVVRYVAGAVVMRVQEVRDWESEKYGPGRSIECVLVGGHLDGEPVEYMLRSQLKRDLETNMADGVVRLGNVYAFRREADKGRAMVIAMYPATQTDEDFQNLGPSEGSEVLTECTTHHTAWTGKSSKTGVRFHLVTLPSGQDSLLHRRHGS